MTARITAIAGSLRRESFNRRLLHAAAHEMPSGARLTKWDGLGAVPPFSEDLEAAPAPAGVAELRQVIAEADAVLLATPSTTGRCPASSRMRWTGRPARPAGARCKASETPGAAADEAAAR
jgi:chromate reductase